MKDDLKLQWVEMKCNAAVSSVHTCGGHVGVQKLYTNMAAAALAYRITAQTKSLRTHGTVSLKVGPITHFQRIYGMKRSNLSFDYKTQVKIFRWHHMQTINIVLYNIKCERYLRVILSTILFPDEPRSMAVHGHDPATLNQEQMKYPNPHLSWERKLSVSSSLPLWKVRRGNIIPIFSIVYLESDWIP